MALIGRSGSGKSTIINLLLRFYPLSNGTITIDGQDIEGSSCRRTVGTWASPQEVILFGGTIRENIAYGKPGATEAEVQEAARKANALEFIERFDDKFETLVGERA